MTLRRRRRRRRRRAVAAKHRPRVEPVHELPQHRGRADDPPVVRAEIRRVARERGREDRARELFFPRGVEEQNALPAAKRHRLGDSARARGDTDADARDARGEPSRVAAEDGALDPRAERRRRRRADDAVRSAQLRGGGCEGGGAGEPEARGGERAGARDGRGRSRRARGRRVEEAAGC
eukprot:30145-Pelagococcus_subviridis.AAC.6